MTQYSFPWNDVNGDRLYDAEDFMRFFAAFLKTGVVMSFKDGLRVRSSQNGMNIQVGAGSGVLAGSSYINDEAIAIQVNVASSIQDRTDSIVLRMDKNARNTYLFYKPSDTTVVRNDILFELQLATLSVKMNATQITDADITDTRSNSEVCGWATPFDNINVDGVVDQYRSIFSQADIEFQDWFTNLQNQLDENQATNLQNQINQLQAEKANNNEVVHNTGDESISGEKTFTDNVSVKNITVAGDVPKTEITTFWANFKEYTTGVYPTYSVKNGRVVLQGAVTPKNNQGGGPTTNYGVFYLPPEIVPLQDIAILSQGSGYNQFCVIAGKDGVLRVGRYTTNGADVTMQTGNWLPFSFTYDL